MQAYTQMTFYSFRGACLLFWFDFLFLFRSNCAYGHHFSCTNFDLKTLQCQPPVLFNSFHVLYAPRQPTTYPNKKMYRENRGVRVYDMAYVLGDTLYKTCAFVDDVARVFFFNMIRHNHRTVLFQSIHKDEMHFSNF